MSSRIRRAVPGAGIALLLAAACIGLTACSSGPAASPRPVVARYLSLWGRRDWHGLASLVARPPRDFSSLNAAAFSALGARGVTFSAGRIRTEGSRSSVPILQRITLPLGHELIVHSSLQLRLRGSRWRVLWRPATINPAFGRSGHYVVSDDWPERAAIYAAGGTVISPAQPRSVVIGLEGSFVKDRRLLEKALVAAGASTAAVAAAISAAVASPTSFVPVLTVNWARYEQLKAALYPLPGVFFHAEGGIGSTPPALVGVVGSLGSINKSELSVLGPPYGVTSVVGQSGLEQAYQTQLAGVPAVTVAAVSGGRDKVLARFPGKAGTPLHTTIDLPIEEDAATALAAAPGYEAALVALDASTGRVLAVANTSQGSDLALEGTQPPGSTMKVITSTALIGRGLSPSSSATCPTTIDVDGEIFHNAGAEGAVPDLLQAFTVSCNTAFIGLTMANLNYRSLHDAASLYRIGTDLKVGMPVFSGSVPVNDGQTDLAASGIGQGRVVMNPLDLAMVAGDVDEGVVRTPWITETAPGRTQPTASLSGTLVADLHEMMLSVVESGTASGTGLPAGTYAKTGTAEYGTGNPLPLDAWLMGFNGKIAFAMVDVDAPGNGGPVDGPIVAHFLDSLGASG